MEDTKYWVSTAAHFGDGTDQLADMSFWSISMIDKADGVQKQCCDMGDVTVFEHEVRLL